MSSNDDDLYNAVRRAADSAITHSQSDASKNNADAVSAAAVDSLQMLQTICVHFHVVLLVNSVVIATTADETVVAPTATLVANGDAQSRDFAARSAAVAALVGQSVKFSRALDETSWQNEREFNNRWLAERVVFV